MKPNQRQHHRRKRQRGVSLLFTTIVLSVMMGMLGITTDLGRVYIAKNELQAFVDSSATAAAFELDGTAAGLDRARDLARSGPAGGAGSPWRKGATCSGGALFRLERLRP